jgi:hypothetical protein
LPARVVHGELRLAPAEGVYLFELRTSEWPAGSK